jgi:hypothetical protein
MHFTEYVLLEHTIKHSVVIIANSKILRLFMEGTIETMLHYCFPFSPIYGLKDSVLSSIVILFYQLKNFHYVMKQASIK